MPTTATTTAKVTTEQLEKVHVSKVENPVDFVRSFVIKNHKKLGRSGCIRELVTKHRIAYYTARTQYQRVHSNGYKVIVPKTPVHTETKPTTKTK